MSDTPTERAEAAATRRRWVSLAEVVAVAGVLIAALTLYNSWSERRMAAAEKTAAAAGEARERGRVDLEATVAVAGDRLTLADERHELQDMAVAFPSSLGVATQHPVDPAIEADWFAAAVLKATDGGSDAQTGRLPVFVTLRYWDGDVARTASGIYDVVWRTEGRVLRGRSLRLEGMRLRQRGGSAAALDAMWKRALAA